MKLLTCVNDRGRLFPPILILTVPPGTYKLLILFIESRSLVFDHLTLDNLCVSFDKK